MRKTMCLLVMAGVLLVWGRAVQAEVAGQKVSQTEAFRQYVARGKVLEEKGAQVDTAIEHGQRRLAGIRDTLWFQVASACIWLKGVIYPFCILSLLCMIFYVVYLVKWHPGKWQLMTSRKTFGLLRDKVLRRNGLLGLLFLVALLAATPAAAKTNVLQDIKMYYTGDAVAQGYLLCKYSKGPINLGYTSVGDVPVFEHPESPFERAYDVLASLKGLAKPITPGEFVDLYAKVQNDEESKVVFMLLARADKDVAQQAALDIVHALTEQRGGSLVGPIRRFEILLAAFAESNNRLLAGALVKAFLEQAATRLRSLEDMDNLVDLAVANGAFETLREPLSRLLQSVPGRMPFAEWVYAARVFFRIDKEKARSFFNTIRYDFREFASAGPVTAKLVDLMRELSGVAAFLPLYDNDALSKSLQQQPNEVRVAVTALFDKVDPALAAVAYSSIGTDSRDIVLRDPGALVTLAALTNKYKKDKVTDLLGSLARTVVELDVPYGRQTLAEATNAMGQSPEAFYESVLSYDMNTDGRFNHNKALILSLIEALPPDQLAAFEGYFVKKTALYEGILTILHAKDEAVFSTLLAQVFATAPGRLAHLRFSNNLVDLKLVAPAFSPKSLGAFASLPASFFVAAHALASPNPDAALARRALVTALDPLFRSFLAGEEKSLTEEEALTALVVLALIDRPEASALADEAFVLDKLVGDYFSGKIRNGQTRLAATLEAREQTLAGVQRDLSVLQSVTILGKFIGFYLIFGLIYLAGGLILSWIYACNVLVPGKNFSLLNWVLHGSEAFAAFAMATLALFPLGFGLKVSTQFLRGLIARETVTPDLAACVAALHPEVCPGGEADHP